MLKHFILLFATALFLVPAPAFAGDKVEDAKGFVDTMAQRAIGFLGDEKLSHDQRKSEFRKLLQAHFDLDTIGRFALGRYWKEASGAQQKEYLRLFDKMVIDVYSKRFEEYKGQNVEVTGGRADGDKDVIVSSKIVPDEGPEVSVDWRVRNKGGKHVIIDVIVEGVSMAVTQRSDFASVIQRGGGSVDVLLDHLRGNT